MREDNEVATTSGSESLSATDGCDWSTEARDVLRCQSMQRLVCQQTQFELDALQDGKPVEAVNWPSAGLLQQGVFLCSAILQECQTRQMQGIS